MQRIIYGSRVVNAPEFRALRECVLRAGILSVLSTLTIDEVHGFGNPGLLSAPVRPSVRCAWPFLSHICNIHEGWFQDADVPSISSHKIENQTCSFSPRFRFRFSLEFGFAYVGLIFRFWGWVHVVRQTEVLL